MGSSLSSAPSTVERPARYGSEEPRIWTPPLRELSPATSAGFACIDFSEQVLGVSLFPWQRWLLIHALELLPDRTYRFRTVVLLVARQNGKSTLMQVLSLWRMFVDGAPLVIGTAQNLDVAEEQWDGAVEIVEGIPELSDELAQVSRVNGKKFLKLRTGERYKVSAASRRGGRGLSGDLILLDELREHQNWEAWGAVTKTTMARDRAQVWAASNAGDASSVVLTFLRRMAHAALGNPDNLPAIPTPTDLDAADVEPDNSLGVFEWSAPPGCGIWDREAWAQANPSLGYKITERAVSSAAQTDPDPVFRTEVLCQWVEIMVRQIPEDAWQSCKLDPTHQASGPLSYALDVSPEGRSASIATSDGEHLEVVKHGDGTGWVVDACVQHRDQFDEIVLDPAGPAGALVAPLEAAGLTVRQVTTREAVQACGGFLTAVLAGAVVVPEHPHRSVLDRAVANADRRDVGDGGWLWSRLRSSVDISPLYAVTLARWAAGLGRPTRKPVFAY